jgi:hypothetical protein
MLHSFNPRNIEPHNVNNFNNFLFHANPTNFSSDGIFILIKAIRLAH